MDNLFVVTDGGYGITETSAANLCAIASQQKAEAEAVLNNVSFVNTDINIIGAGNDKFMRTGAGYTDVDGINKAVDIIQKMNAFIAWFAEGRKQLEKYREEFTRVSFREWCKDNNITIPEEPADPSLTEVTEQDILNNMSIGERLDYLKTEAECAVLGKAIHKDGSLQRARALMHKSSKAPYSTSGEGKDLIISKNELSINPEAVDALYNNLQAQYRSKERKLNAFKSTIKTKLTQAKQDADSIRESAQEEWQTAYKKYDVEMTNLRGKFTTFKDSLSQKAAKFKIAIPNELKKTMDELNSLVND